MTCDRPGWRRPDFPFRRYGKLKVTLNKAKHDRARFLVFIARSTLQHVSDVTTVVDALWVPGEWNAPVGHVGTS